MKWPIFMSGHGSYQPAPPGSDELDDRDEVFLPADAGYVVGNENTPSRMPLSMTK